MGSKAGAAIAGVALLAVAPYALPFVGIQAGFAASLATQAIVSGAIQLAGAMVIGNAFAPDLGAGDFDQGTVLRTQRSNTNAVPVVYGENKLAGNVIWQYTNNYGGGTTRNDYWAIVVFAQGEINSFLKIYDNDEETTINANGTRTTTYLHVNPYTNSGSGIALKDVEFAADSAGTKVLGSTIFGTIIPTVSSTSSGSAGNLVDGSYTTNWTPSTTSNEWIKFISNVSSTVTSASVQFWGDGQYSFKLQYSDDDVTYYDASSLEVVVYSTTSQPEWFQVVSNESNAHDHWRVFFAQIENLTPGGYVPAPVWEFTSVSSAAVALSIPANVSFLAIHETYDATNNNQLSNATALIQGKKINPFYESGGSYYISGSPIYSNLPPLIVFDILKQSLNVQDADIDVKSFYDATVFCVNNNLFCNIIFPTQQNTESSLQAVLSTFRGNLTYSNGKWKLLYDHNANVVKALDESDIIDGSFSVSMSPNADIANKVTVKYVNPLDEWQIAKVDSTNSALVTLDGGETEQILEIKGSTSSVQSQKLAELSLNKMRYSEDSGGNRINQTPLNVSFATTIKNAELEVGDVISINHYMLNFIRKFRILSIETDQSGLMKIECLEHCTTHYKTSSNSDIIT